MKKINILFVLMLTPFTTWSQNYTPLLDDRNEWQLTSCYFGCLTDVYFTDGDTIANNHTYKILDGYHYISRTFLLREEIEQQKIYLGKVNDENQIEEYLLYDFSLEEQDSIEIRNPITPFPPNSGFYKLDSIKHLPLVNGNLYKHYYLSPTSSNSESTTPAIWVEGLGSLSMINAPAGFPDINGVGQISCFFKNQTLFYEDLDSISSCKSILKIQENKILSMNYLPFFIKKVKKEFI